MGSSRYPLEAAILTTSDSGSNCHNPSNSLGYIVGYSTDYSTDYANEAAVNAIELKLFSSRVASVCDEMGLVLRRTSFSPNIKDRLDFSCALFASDGRLFAQAAHIPVHLGSMAYAMASIVQSRKWQQGDMLVLNDPFLGGTHLPDVTLIAPVFIADGATLIGFVANRAHHANIGCDTPGSMPLANRLEDEGVIIPPTLLYKAGRLQVIDVPLADLSGGSLDGDFAAQAGANEVGVLRLQQLVNKLGIEEYSLAMEELNRYADRLAQKLIARLQPGKYRFEDFLDDDGFGSGKIKLVVVLTIDESSIVLDFTECAKQVPGNLNCPESVVAAAAFYCLRCLMPEEAPTCAGLFARIQIRTTAGLIVNAESPAAVAAGNVETSTRLVDLVFGALAKALPQQITAASQGTMNNVAMGYIDNKKGSRWDYYETLAGGMGGGPHYAGLDAVHSHMTNTLNTPVESLEMHYPLRIRQYSIRRGSGGKGKFAGGNGIEREYEFLERAQLSLLTERRLTQPWGLEGGAAGKRGINSLNGVELPGKCSVTVTAGDRLKISTPGGGAWGS